LLASANAGIHGVAPLMRADDRITFIGDSNICDFMDFLVSPEHSDEPYADLWRQLTAEEWEELELWGLMASSPKGAFEKSKAEEAGYKVVEEQEAVSPPLALPETWEDYLSSLNKKDRHELRRKIRRAFDSGAEVTFDCLSTQADVVAGMSDFLDL